jgi:hypothetical protein
VFTHEEQKQIEALMKLGNSREEAEQVILDDRAEVETPEMKAMAESAKKNGLLKVSARVEDAYGRKRTRVIKPNLTKLEIIQTVAEGMAELPDKLEVVNPERQIDFWLDGKHYSLTLTQHRLKRGDA